ncbi:hypothetical protein K2173_017493 [Erythroxylum novogranatense]|uniref:Uncharacterized protein n=1 Tax=Erythroxylum novogranatense TaxID=1862640 RepID=A0AAV8TMY8_9ROSI|nr:hypothetical protein K2173_017493 [Erythroxylum novogranatense]
MGAVGWGKGERERERESKKLLWSLFMFLSVHTAFSNVVSLSLFLFSSLQFQGTSHSQDKPEFGMSILEELFGTRVSDPLNSSWSAESLIAATSISRERNRFGEVFDSSGPP